MTDLGDPTPVLTIPLPAEGALWTHPSAHCAIRADEVLHVAKDREDMGRASVFDGECLTFFFSSLKFAKTRSIPPADRDDAFQAFVDFATRRARLRGERGLWTHRGAGYAIRADAISCVLAEDVPSFDGGGMPQYFLTFRLPNPHVIMHRYDDAQSRDEALRAFVDFANREVSGHP